MVLQITIKRRCDFIKTSSETKRKKKKTTKRDEKILHRLNELEQQTIILSGTNKLLEEMMNEFETSSAQQLRNEILKMKDMERKYHNLYDSSPILFRTVNLDGTILDCNTLYANSLGYSKNEIIGNSLFEHAAEQSTDTMKKSFEQWKKTGIVNNEEIWLKRKDGTIFPTLLSATNLFNDEGALIGSNTALRDITEIHEARKKIEDHESKMNEQLIQLKRLGALKDDFLTMITHELKTPLVPIISYLDIIMSEKFGQLNEEQKKRLEIIRVSTGSLLKLISDLLDAQKIELGQLILNKDMHDLSQIIRNVVAKMKPCVDRNNIELTIDSEERVMVFCDNSRMEQVLSNLIFNSLDFCPKQNGKIDLKLYSENNGVHIVVKDNGIGMTKENIEKIFVKFYQVDASLTREHGGTGMGLAVCKGIVEGHNGKIWAESEGRGKGVEMHILLPFLSNDHLNN